MRCSEENASKSDEGRKLWPFFLAAMLVVASLLSSCQTPQEKKGASVIPVSRPATWEDNLLNP